MQHFFSRTGRVVGAGNSGGSSSTESPKPELLEEPWRKIDWASATRTNLMEYLKDYKPAIDSVPQARILLIGAVSAGKSSFFNSINSIFRGNMTCQAQAGEVTHSLTLKYRTYEVKDGRGGRPLSFLLCDTMGLEAAEDGGVKVEDIESILKGYVPNKYQFNPVQPMKRDGCQAYSSVPLKDRIHCVVYVMDSSSAGRLHPNMKKKVDEIQAKTNLTKVPLMVLLTKVDEACPRVGEDLRNVYYSRYIKEQVERASQCLGIPVSHVVPVKNYTHQLQLDDTCDILLLSAMQQILNFADSFLEFSYDTQYGCASSLVS